MKTVIIGGVAGGASAAARLRRLDENSEIMLLERGPDISYANCGLPYHLGGIIPERDWLLVMTPENFRARFNVDVRVNHEVTSIDREKKVVAVLNRQDGSVHEEQYDKLLIATGSSPMQLNLPGIDLPEVLQLWTLGDMDRIAKKLDAGARRVVVVGGGFVGMELAESLRHRGLEVTLLEMGHQLLPTMDKEMSSLLAEEMRLAGIVVELGAAVSAFASEEGGGVRVAVQDGRTWNADLVALCVGVKPNSALAKDAGLDLGARGHIVTDSKMCTNDPDIYAVGDVVEVLDPIFNQPTAIPLAGPANRQGRIAADQIAGRDNTYAGTYGASVVKVGNLTAASCGHTEARLKAMDKSYRKIYLHPGSHAGYYPGAKTLHIKLLFGEDGKIYGGQVVGGGGVDKRVDVLAVAMRAGQTVQQLAEMELCYAPPFSSAKDPITVAGMIASNVLNGDSVVAHADALPEDILLLDVREPAEVAQGTLAGSTNIPLHQLRAKAGALPRDRKVVVFCQVGLRGYVAERILRQMGFDVANLSGGYLTWTQFQPEKWMPTDDEISLSCTGSEGGPHLEPDNDDPGIVVDVRAMQCPGPVVRIKKELDSLATGTSIKVLAASGFAPDLNNWTKCSGHKVVKLSQKADHLEAIVRKGTAPACSTSGGSASSGALVLFSNDLDKAMAAMIMAMGMAAAGMQVSIFFTFWGLTVLRKNPGPQTQKTLLSRMFGWMLPKGASKLALSKMHMAGMGTAMMKHVMQQQNVASLPEMIQSARELGVKFIACDMAMGVMGIEKDELIEVDEVAGVATFIARAKESGPTLFI
jgi:NADPH-dependent 2,4-dienoyl-CoA reductase/sulfur reductase-like enzyme/peroxiredoxin family protein/rhodanese-related sulfurtransferase/TusA-related sulfurtransferase